LVVPVGGGARAGGEGAESSTEAAERAACSVDEQAGGGRAQAGGARTLASLSKAIERIRVGSGTQDLTIWLTERERWTRLALLHEILTTKRIESSTTRHLYSARDMRAGREAVRPWAPASPSLASLHCAPVQWVLLTSAALKTNINMAPPRKEAI
jgi:hypothetical protein